MENSSVVLIKPFNHCNSGFGNKLFLSCFAECYAKETEATVYNWLDTNLLYCGERDGIPSYDKNYIKWKNKDINIGNKNVYIVGKGTNLSTHEFHQSPSDIQLIKKYKDTIVKDFGRREGVFVHVRTQDRKSKLPCTKYLQRWHPPTFEEMQDWKKT